MLGSNMRIEIGLIPPEALMKSITSLQVSGDNESNPFVAKSRMCSMTSSFVRQRLKVSMRVSTAFLALTIGAALHTVWIRASFDSAQHKQSNPAERPPYLDTELSFEQRAADLVSRMTTEEKLSQVMNDAPAIPRLGVPKYEWWNEALHGVARAGAATVFPQAIGMAASFDTDLMHEVAVAISDDGSTAYVANLMENSISVIDTANRSVEEIGSVSTPFDLAFGPCPPSEVTCTGDCDESGAVAINELISGVNITLGNRPLEICMAFDNDQSGTVTISELIQAVNNVLDGCPS